MPRRLTIDNHDAGYVLSERESDNITLMLQDRIIHVEQQQRTRDDVARLQGRIEALERSNAELREAFSRSTSQVTAPVQVQRPISNPVPAPAAATAVAAPAIPAGAVVPGVQSAVQGVPNAPGVTLDAVRSALQRFSQANGMENARRLMQQFGFQAVSQVPENRRADLLTAIERASSVPVATASAGV